MSKNNMRELVFSVLLAGAGAFQGVQAAGADCMAIGGLGMPNFVPQDDGTITIVAPLSGSAASAAGKITAQRKTETGLEMDMEHYFMTKEGGFMYTKDIATLTTVMGKKDRYMVEIAYAVQPDSTSGVLAGYTGSFKSYGLVDLENFQGLIRYSGEICK